MHKLAPELSKSRARIEIVARWENFAYNLVNSPTIRNELRRRQNNLCGVCLTEVPLGEEHVHHLSYMNICYTSQNVDSVPPCTGCNRLERCLVRLSMVHCACHELIHASSPESLDVPKALAEVDLSKAKYPQRNAPWKSEDEAVLRQLHAEGKKNRSIALALGRSIRSIQLRLELLNLVDTKESKKRKKASLQTAIRKVPK